MPRIDIELIMHHLYIAPSVKHVKQKLRKMYPHVTLLVKVELEKLLSAKFIRATKYAKWMSDIILVLKYDKYIHVCTDFLGLNKAFPKDDFSLLNIDMIVDMTMGYEMSSLMDGILDYNQIKIVLEDQEKISFTCA